MQFAQGLTIVLLIIVILLITYKWKSPRRDDSILYDVYNDVPNEDAYLPFESPPDDRYIYFSDRNVYLLPYDYLDFSLPQHRWMYYHYPEFYYSYYNRYWPFRGHRHNRFADGRWNGSFVNSHKYPTRASGFNGGRYSQRFIDKRAYKSGLTSGRAMGGFSRRRSGGRKEKFEKIGDDKFEIEGTFISDSIAPGFPIHIKMILSDGSKPAETVPVITQQIIPIRPDEYIPTNQYVNDSRANDTQYDDRQYEPRPVRPEKNDKSNDKPTSPSSTLPMPSTLSIRSPLKSISSAINRTKSTSSKSTTAKSSSKERFIQLDPNIICPYDDLIEQVNVY